MNEVILFFISWILAGLISIMILLIRDMRNTPYDENYFKKGDVPFIMFMVAFGWFSLIIIIFICLKRIISRCLPRLLWEIANIGINKEEINTN